MTKEKFYNDYCELSGITFEEAHRLGMRAEKCECNDTNCNGWRMDTTFVKHNDSIEIGDVECLFDSHIISIDSANQTLSIGECVFPIPEGKEDYLVKYLSEFMREIKMHVGYEEGCARNFRLKHGEPLITDFIPFIGTDRKVDFCVNVDTQHWVRGTVHGVNVPQKQVLVFGDGITTLSASAAHWHDLYVLPRHDKKTFKIRIV